MTPKTLVEILALLTIIVVSRTANALTDGATEEHYLPIPELTQPIHEDDEPSIFDEVRIHAGAAFIDSFQNFAIAPGVREQGAVPGFQLNLGADLFNPHWICEGALVDLPQTMIGDTKISSNGFELRLLYEATLVESITFHLGAGIASRYYDITTTARPDGNVASGEQNFSSGATVIASGVDYWIDETFSAGFELANHLPMASGDEPSSIDMAVRLSGHF